MNTLMNFLHVGAAIVWLGGVTFMLFALRPAVLALPPPQRLPLMAQVLRRFFMLVWPSIGLLMFAVFGHLYFGPFRRLRAAVEAADWPQAGQRVGQIAKLAQLNLALGALAIAAVTLWR